MGLALGSTSTGPYPGLDEHLARHRLVSPYHTMLLRFLLPESDYRIREALEFSDSADDVNGLPCRTPLPRLVCLLVG